MSWLMVCLFAQVTQLSVEPLLVTSEPPLVLASVRPEPKVVDLNRATLAELLALPGIGEGRARKILAHRLRRPFRRPSDLLRVRGIGRSLYRQLRPWIRVERPGAAFAKGEDS